MSKFVISTDDEEIQYLRNCDKRLARVINSIGDIECSIHDNGYEFIIFQIIGQMLSNKVADVLVNRLLEKCNNEITPHKIINMGVQELRNIGVSNAKAEYILNFSQMVNSKEIDLVELENLNDRDVIVKLTQIRGIGTWTAKMYLLFVLRREDILPHEDGAFLQSFKWLYKLEEYNKQSIEKKCKKWKPYSSYAARYLYRALDMGLTKNPFHLYKN